VPQWLKKAILEVMVFEFYLIGKMFIGLPRGQESTRERLLGITLKRALTLSSQRCGKRMSAFRI
jgi:hypothetical protein